MYVNDSLRVKYYCTFIFTLMEIGDYVNSQIQEKELTKQFVSSSLGISRQGFDLKLKTGNFNVNEFLRLSIIIGFDPDEYFKLNTPNVNQNDRNQLNEPANGYRKVKKYDNKVLNSNTSDVSELIRQNGELIQIIKSLTTK